MDLQWLDGYTQWRANNLTNLTNSTENDWTPAYSPVENKIIYSTYFPENDNYDIFIMNDDGSNKTNLTNSKSYENFHLSFIPSLRDSDCSGCNFSSIHSFRKSFRLLRFSVALSIDPFKPEENEILPRPEING